MRDRLRAWLRREVTAPRWVAILWFLRDTLLVVGACVVIVLWWQAATRDEEADRNLRVQACSSEYAATYDGWIAEFTRTASDPISRQQAADNAAEMVARRIGIARMTQGASNDFTCPPIPARLEVAPFDPDS